jgi:hypothetical protein
MTRVNPLYPPALPRKLAIHVLDPPMAEPKESKFLIPHPLEIYTAEELNGIAPQGTSAWHNRYDNPQEPAKCWTAEKFAEVYDKPGFHFLIAKLALLRVAARDPKLPTLQSLLAERWTCKVKITRMNPRQDWMMCTIPDTAGPRQEILTAVLIRLHSGNTSYIVRNFNEPSRIRELDISIPNFINNPNIVFSKLKKTLLEYQGNNIELGWRVVGVRKVPGIGKFRGTFALDSTATYWPWAMKFGHLHGSLPPFLPLLNIEPTWSAKKPYACQCCFNSDHYINECPLQRIKIRGQPLISQQSLLLIKNRKAAERVVSTDNTLKPRAPLPTDPRMPPPQAAKAPRPNETTWPPVIYCNFFFFFKARPEGCVL